MDSLCQARLTNYHKSKTKIGNQDRWNATYLKLCPNEADRNSEKGLCERCSQRPLNARNQITMIHGTLSEKIPYSSRIYGGDWYWDMVERFGEPVDKAWIQLAEEAQREGERRALSCGKTPWQIQKEAETKEGVKTAQEEEEMPPIAKPKPKAKAKTKTKAKEVLTPPPGTPKLPFKPIPQLYQESMEEPKMMPTDTQKIWKEDGKWVCETGFLFEIREDGGIGKLIRISRES